MIRHCYGEDLHYPHAKDAWNDHEDDLDEYHDNDDDDDEIMLHHP